MTSSKIKTILFESHKERNSLRKFFLGGTQPILPATGSSIIAAILFLFSAILFLTPSMLLYSAIIVSLAVPFVTPGELGTPIVLRPEPAFIKN
jgi:phosphatidylglycerophosphatase A